MIYCPALRTPVKRAIALVTLFVLGPAWHFWYTRVYAASHESTLLREMVNVLVVILVGFVLLPVHEFLHFLVYRYVARAPGVTSNWVNRTTTDGAAMSRPVLQLGLLLPALVLVVGGAAYSLALSAAPVAGGIAVLHCVFSVADFACAVKVAFTPAGLRWDDRDDGAYGR